MDETKNINHILLPKEERYAKWRDIFPVKLKPRDLTESEFISWKEYQSVRTLKTSVKQRKFIAKIYSDVFNVPYYLPCCSVQEYLIMIERMDKIVSTYE